ncbi:hypothetical protein EYF80_049677 [Liparis tanakae]|uniref:Uncharacterized protein n=1 Tax=Liparis tanakae TaxID=230148 RepID=A0A4Z2FH94_9TELE|nr:hypothetical protein EYF80_049677 [Liparis tanakae]
MDVRRRLRHRAADKSRSSLLTLYELLRAIWRLRLSNSSSLLKERSEVTARLWRLPLRISQAT